MLGITIPIVECWGKGIQANSILKINSNIQYLFKKVGYEINKYIK